MIPPLDRQLLTQENGFFRARSGFNYSLGSVIHNGTTTTPSLTDFSADLAASLAPCAQLSLDFGDESMSDASTCLALSCFVRRSWG